MHEDSNQMTKAAQSQLVAPLVPQTTKTRSKKQEEDKAEALLTPKYTYVEARSSGHTCVPTGRTQKH